MGRAGRGGRETSTSKSARPPPSTRSGPTSKARAKMKSHLEVFSAAIRLENVSNVVPDLCMAAGKGRAGQGASGPGSKRPPLARVAVPHNNQSLDHGRDGTGVCVCFCVRRQRFKVWTYCHNCSSRNVPVRFLKEQVARRSPMPSASTGSPGCTALDATALPARLPRNSASAKHTPSSQRRDAMPKDSSLPPVHKGVGGRGRGRRVEKTQAETTQ